MLFYTFSSLEWAYLHAHEIKQEKQSCAEVLLSQLKQMQDLNFAGTEELQ